MALAHSPSIVTDGLVFAYDRHNIRSYKGPVMQNLANAISIIGTGTGTGYSSTAVTETVDIPDVGLSTVYTNVIQNNYTSYTPNSSSCCPSLHSWGSISVSPSTLYTYLILYRCESGYTHPNYMYRYEYTSNGGTYVAEAGVHNDSNRVHLGGGWYYAWGTFTTQSTTNWIGGASTFYYRYFNLPDRLSVAKVMIVAGNYSGIHPRYWPNQATSRSSTTAIVDLTGKNTITASNLTYASDGTFSFSENASSTLTTNNLPITSLPALSGHTYEAWVKCTAYPTVSAPNGYGVTYKSGVLVGATYYSGSALYWYGNASGNVCTIYGFVRGDDSYRATTGYNLNLNTYYHLVTTHSENPKKLRLYVNGVLYSEVTGATSEYNATNAASAGNVGVNKPQIDGGGTANYSYFNGSIDSVKVYNKGLTASEILSNFNALRGRYGI